MRTSVHCASPFSPCVSVYEPQRCRGSFHPLHVSSGELFSLCSPSRSAVAGDWSPDPTSWGRSLSHAGIWQPIMKAFEVFIWDLFPFLPPAFPQDFFFSFLFSSHLRPPALAHHSPASRVYPSVFWTLNHILADGTIHLAKVLAIKGIAVWSTIDGVCYQCQGTLYSTPGHLHFVLGSCLQLWPSTSHSFTVLHVFRQQMCAYTVKLLAKDFGRLPWCT